MRFSNTRASADGDRQLSVLGRAGSVDRLTVAVLVDESVEPAPDPVQLLSLVAAAVGIDETRGDSIVVESLVFDEVIVQELEGAGAAAAGGGLEPMIGYAKTGVAIIGMLLALLFLRKGLKTLTPVSKPVDIDPAQLAALTAGDSEGRAGDEAATSKEKTKKSKKDAKAIEAGAAAAISAAAASLDVDLAATDTNTTVDMFDLIDSQSDEVAYLLRDLMADVVG